MNIDLRIRKDKAKEKMLTIAIGKGRGFEESLQLVSTTISAAYHAFAKGVLPVYVDQENNVRLVKVRNKDLPWLLSKEHIDAAIGSSVWFEEFSDTSSTLLTELPLLKCRLSLIAAKQIPLSQINAICSKFQFLSDQYIKKNKLDASLLLMEGCHEVALSLGMSDAIIDIIETGNTIRKMNFIELECIQHITHGLWTRTNRVSDLESLITPKKELHML